MKNFLDYFKGSVNELKLVTWPKQDELLRLTIINVIFVLIFAVIMGGIDFGFARAYQWLLTLS